MIPMVSRRGRLLFVAMVTGLGVGVGSVGPSFAQEGTCTYPLHGSKNARFKQPQAGASMSGAGTLGYGAPGLHPGFQGFGLGYHLGYGYGGSALGVGAEGGYPFYGGPGYPHPDPVLSRKLAIVPFCYFGGPGYPTPDHPHFFGTTGALVDDRPVVTFEPDPTLPIQEVGYGPYHGALPYPESTFAPFATSVGDSGNSNAPSPRYAPANSAALVNNSLGMTVEPFAETGRSPGLKITGIIAASLVEKAGLHVGDVIVSINGYVTQKATDPDWILQNASSEKVLKMIIRNVADGQEKEVIARLP